MADPFRDSETTALARVEDLESENQRLSEELELARNQAGSNHQAYVKHLEDQIVDLKKENAHLRAQPSLIPKRSRPWDADQQRMLGVAIMLIVLALLGFFRAQ